MQPLTAPSIRRAFQNCLFGLGALAAFASSTAHAQYTDWTASPPKILPNERVGSCFTGSGRQYPNQFAFAALKADGSITAWGDAYRGGSGAPTGTGFTALYSSSAAFAALKADGSITAWGLDANVGSGAPAGSGYTAIYSTLSAFAALRQDGSITAWGGPFHGGSGAPTDSGYTAIYSTSGSFAALKADGSITAWGDASRGGSGAPSGTGFTAVYSNSAAFAALKADGSITVWGHADYGGSGAPTGSGYTAIYSTVGAFAAIRQDGSITAWGVAANGGSGAPAGSGYTEIYSTSVAFAALKADGSITAWGSAIYGGSGAPSGSGYTAVYSNNLAFAALREDGSIAAWGYPFTGGSGAPAGSGYTAIYSTPDAFAALREDGSITTWGNSTNGGSGAPSGSGFTAIYSTSRAFAALREDGSISAWGAIDTYYDEIQEKDITIPMQAPAGSDFRSIQSVSYYNYGAVITAANSSITSTTASVSGEVVSEGKSPVIGRGFVYALAAVTDPKIGDAGVTQVVDGGSGAGSFSSVLRGLAPNTAYTLRSYAINDQGTTYSAAVGFSTNLPPVFLSQGGASAASLTIAENSSAVTTINGSDEDPGQTITYRISGGTDAARFAIGATTGVLTFVTAPDYEVPSDVNGDNVYEVIVSVTDDGNPPKSATQTLTITVSNLFDNGALSVEQPAGTALVNGGSVNFGSQTIGQPTELTFTLRSQGEADLRLPSSIAISGAAAADFSLVSSVPSVLNLGNSITFSLRFSPTSNGVRAAILSIPTNDTRPGRSPYIINLTGNGSATPIVASYANAANQVRGGWINSGNFTIGAVGTTSPGNNWPSGESPDKVVDANTASKFLIYRNNNAGFILSPTNANVVFNRLSLSTANDSTERDPASYVIYGSTTLLTGTAGTNISLEGLKELASGSITLPDNRSTGPTVVQFANTTAYASYIVAFPTVRSTSGNNITQISEVQLSQGINPPFAVAMAGARGGQLSSGTFTFGSIGSSNPGTNWNANESPDQAIDGSVDTKYLIFRNTGAGLIASPQAGSARVNRLSFWTANDSSERDPLTYEVYGFATAVTARSGTLNVATNGTLLDSGTLTLPATRNSGPQTVTFDNSTVYASYLVVFPTVKNSPSTTMMQISEVQFGYNGTPAFALSAATITVAEDSGSYSSGAFATGITPGIGDVGQTVSFNCTNDNNALFSVQPAIAVNGTLTFTPAANANGSTMATVVATDSTGLSSASQSFTIVVTSVIDAPVLATTTTSASITTTTATLGGEVTASDASVTERGVVYSITSANAAPQIGGTDVTKLSTSGTTGVFTADVSGLTAGTGYSFRAYATNSAGTSYSEVGTFSTTSAASLSDLWRLQYFGTTANSGSAADLATPDGDGIANLLKYALCITPGTNGADSMPKSIISDQGGARYLSVHFSRDPTLNDVTIVVEAQSDLGGTWTEIARSENGGSFTGTGGVTETTNQDNTKNVEVRDSVEMSTAAKRFLRVRVVK